MEMANMGRKGRRDFSPATNSNASLLKATEGVAWWMEAIAWQKRGKKALDCFENVEYFKKGFSAKQEVGLECCLSIYSFMKYNIIM